MLQLCAVLLWLSVPVVGSTSCESRNVLLEGDPSARGASLVQMRGAAIRRLWEARKAHYGQTPGALAEWEDMAQQALQPIMHHAPVAFAELKGAVERGREEGITLKVMVMLAVEYEMSMKQPTMTQRCTAFARPGLAGQNDDETPSDFLNGAEDTVFHMKGGGQPEALIFTHPGMAAYMGMNEHGLSVMWQTVDDGERAVGVPTTVLIREMLAHTSLESALQFLEHTPRTIPNNFILTDGSRVVNCEVSPKRFTATVVTKGYVAHTNHFIFDQAMQDHDVYVYEGSIQRLKAMRDMVRTHELPDGDVVVSATDLEGMLSVHPVLRDAHAGTDNDTLASMVFDSAARSMHIRFKGDPFGSFCRYQFSQSRPFMLFA